MKHLGDITKIDWSAVEPVDAVCGGSPCQDLSVAGKRAGLAGERSGLYMEQIRCVKELREADVRRGRTGQFIRPRYMVWENVPGAFSSGNPKGADFAAVIEEIIKVVEQDAYVCVMPPSGGWTKSGCYYDSDGRWSIAWRVHDSQFWGVPQRRKRIALVADFGGLSAPEILFERKGLRGNFAESGTQRQGAAEDAEGSIGADDKEGTDVAYTLKIRSGCEVDSKGKAAGKGALIQTDKSGTLSATQDQYLFQPIVYGISPYHSNAMLSSNPHSGIYEADTSRTLDLNGGNPSCNQGGIAVVEPQLFENHSQDSRYKGPLNVCPMLPSQLGTGGNNTPFVVEPIVLDRAFYNQGVNAQYDPQLYTDGTCPTLVAKGPAAVLEAQRCRTSYIVRRLTPLECERLQGFPDGWTDIGKWTDSKGRKRKEADSPRYKALGNSIALPFWKWLLKRISAQYERDATLGSLFDGIGGFPLIWEQINGKGSARWASEIEEFPIAVTKLRFGEE